MTVAWKLKTHWVAMIPVAMGLALLSWIQFKARPEMDQSHKRESELAKKLLLKVDRTTKLNESACRDFIRASEEHLAVHRDSEKTLLNGVRGLSVALIAWGVAFHFVLLDVIKKAVVK